MLIKQVSWQQILFIFLHLKISFISPLFLKDPFHWMKNSGLTVFFFQHLKMLFHFFLAPRVMRNLLKVLPTVCVPGKGCGLCYNREG